MSVKRYTADDLLNWAEHIDGLNARPQGVDPTLAPALLDALEYLAECSPCQNGCDPKDMTCATQRARAVITLAHRMPRTDAGHEKG